MAFQTPCPWLTLFFLLAILLPSAYGDTDTQFIYTGFERANLTLKGIATIHPNGLLQLTNNSQHKAGYAFHPHPIKFTNHNNSRSFSLAFVFAIFPQQQLQSLGAQGMAFVISPNTDFNTALPDEYLGLFNASDNGNSSNHIFAVELDTIQNPAFADIDGNHVGIDVDGLRSVEAATASYYSDKDNKNETLSLTAGEAIQVWVDYDEPEMLMNVTMAPIQVPKPSRNLLSTHVNLSTLLLDTMYVGFSASTGITTSSHYVLGWTWNQTGLAQSLDPSNLPSLPKFQTSKRRPGTAVIILLVVISLLIATVLASAYVMRRKKYDELKDDWEKEYAPHRFSYKDLYTATRGFKSSELLGAGGFGKVYKGTLIRNGNLDQVVAVKRVSHHSHQGMREFVAEIASMRRLRHRNLVQLLGYCRRKGELLLVYEFMPNGSLDSFLFEHRKPTLSWEQRMRIIRGVASALLYLHDGWDQVVLHRDVKASNVLLDSQMNAKLGDFGLARLYDHGTNPRTTHVVGTVGYLAPDFARTGKATTSTDVFAFGMFTLEVACGKRPYEVGRIDEEEEIEEEEGLVDWVLNLWKKGAILEAGDCRLESNYDPDEVEMVLKMGLLCSHSNPEARFNMRQVVQILDRRVALPDIPPDLDVAEGGHGWFGVTVESLGTSSSFPTSSFEKGAQAGSISSCDSILQNGR